MENTKDSLYDSGAAYSLTMTLDKYKIVSDEQYRQAIYNRFFDLINLAINNHTLDQPELFEIEGFEEDN